MRDTDVEPDRLSDKTCKHRQLLIDQILAFFFDVEMTRPVWALPRSVQGVFSISTGLQITRRFPLDGVHGVARAHACEELPLSQPKLSGYGPGYL